MTRLTLDTDARPALPLVLPVFQREEELVPTRRAAGYPAALWRNAREDGFTGKAGETHLLRPGDRRPADRVMLAGLGRTAEADGQTLRLLGAGVARRLTEARWPAVRVLVPDDVLTPGDAVQALTEGFLLAGYRFDRHKSDAAHPRGPRDIRLWAPAGDGLARRLETGRVFAEAVCFARDLVNEPPSRKTPEVLGRAARALAGGPVRVRVLGKTELRRRGADALLGVNRGSAHPPVMVHLRYTPAGKPRRRLAFVGKGITFDSGGLSLKPADGMMTMKYDMAGAATVFSLFKALPRLAPPVEVHGLCPLTENMPGPDAYKPGDVVKALNGKTIEVLNTDAEGRVVLADALSYAARLPVDQIIDVATLTGAVTVALGRAYAALMTNTPGMETALRAAAKAAGEKMWPLPLEASYREHIRSKVADLKNIGNPGEAGTIVGGLFLEEFVAGKPWAHVDMAGVGWSAAGGPLGAPGATGAMVRSFLNYILEVRA